MKANGELNAMIKKWFGAEAVVFPVEGEEGGK
jgi:ABC-type amino acid transport substrate-binding protein